MATASASGEGIRRGPTLFGHPAGLTVLFTTQMWAEFSFFGLQALLVYYMTKQLHFPQAKSSLIYGAYGGAALVSPLTRRLFDGIERAEPACLDTVTGEQVWQQLSKLLASAA